jgi:CubicO group peptidase (beta-lactamase class C family)
MRKTRFILLGLSFALLIINNNNCLVQGQSSKQLTDEIEQEVRLLKEVYNVPGLSVAVVSGNQIVLAKGYGISNIDRNINFDEHTVGRLASATKFLTCLAVLVETQKGIINLNDPLKEYISDVSEEWKDIPLWSLMNLTSGIPGTEKTPFDNMTEDEQRRISERDLFEMINKLPLDYKPGEKWAYRQTGYMIVAMIISGRTGKSWQEIIKEAVLQPAGMTNTGHNDATIYPPDLVPKNYVFNNDGRFVNSPFFFPLVLSTGAGYNTSASDMAKLFVAINQHKVLSPELISAQEFNKEYMYPLGEGQYYSIASELKTFGPYLTIGHSGGPDLANIRYSPDKRIGVAVLANRNTTGICEELTNRILKRMLLDSAFSVQKRSVGFAIRRIAEKSSYEQLLGFYDSAKTSKKYYFMDEEKDLTNAAYELLFQNKLNSALNIFKLIVKNHPDSANAYDSLGEAYLKIGNKELALQNYQKSVSINPNNDNAKKIIEFLQNK